jgi:hypothetical protein
MRRLSTFNPYRAVVNANAGGAWTAAEGVEVEVIDHAANGRAVLVRMPRDCSWSAKAGKDCWIARAWVDSERVLMKES